MDENKLKVLQDIEYKIQPSCGLCTNGNFKPNTLFGTCSANKYTHLKHTGEDRELSVNKHGSCFKFKLANESTLATILGDWTRFIPEG